MRETCMVMLTGLTVVSCKLVIPNRLETQIRKIKNKNIIYYMHLYVPFLMK